MGFKLRETRRGCIPGRILRCLYPAKDTGYWLRGIKSQKGQALIEVLIGLTILGIVAVSFLAALTTASGAIIIADERTNAESLARTELEYVKSQSFSDNPWSYIVSTTGYSTDSSYPSWWDETDPDFHKLPAEYNGYSAKVTAEGYDADNADGDDNPATGPDAGIWMITVRVYHSDTPPDDLILTTSTYKLDR